MKSRYELCALDFELTLTRRETAATPAADQAPAAAKPPVIDLAAILEAATRLDPVRPSDAPTPYRPPPDASRGS